MQSGIPFDGKTLVTTLVVILISIRGSLSQCPQNEEVDLTGSDITDISRNLSKTLDYLLIFRTNINVLNLTVGIDYPVMCRLDVRESPVTTLITPTPPQTTALTYFHLVNSGTFPSPPDLGSVLSEQLEFLSFDNIGINTVPENYFQNYSKLISLVLNDNPITYLNAGSLAAIEHLKMLYLDRTNINPVPQLHLWLPNLSRLHIQSVGMAILPGSLIENLPQLKSLDLRNNQLSTVPAKEYFINLQNMKDVFL